MEINDYQQRIQNLIWLARGVGTSTLIALATYLILYVRDRSWQLLVVSGILSVAIGCLVIAGLAAQQGKFEKAGRWLTAGIIIGYGSAALVLEGVTLPLTISSSLLIIIVASVTTPERWKGWVAVLALTALGTILIDNMAPLTRYPTQNTLIAPLVLLVTALAILITQWQTLRLGGQVSTLEETLSRQKRDDALLHRQLKELTILHSVAVAGAEARSEDELIERVTQIMGETLYPDSFGFLLLDESGKNLQIHPSYHLRPGAIRLDSIPLGEGVTGMVAENGLPRRIDNVCEEQNYRSGDPGIRSELCAPLKVEGEILGVANAESLEVGAFSEADERLMITLAGQVATAIDRLRRTTEIQHKAQQLAAIYDVGKQLTAILDLDPLLAKVGRLIVEALGVHNAEIALVEGKMLRFYAGYGGYTEEGLEPGYALPLGQGITGKVAATGMPMLVPDVLESPDYRHYDNLPNVRTELTVPLKINEAIIGVLDIKSDRPYGLDDDDLALLETLAAQVAIAVQNARLFKAERDRRAELEALRQASLSVTSSLELEPVLKAIMEHALKLSHGHDAHIYLYDGENLSFGAAQWADRAFHKPYQLPRKDGITTTVARTGQRLVIPDVKGHPLFEHTPWVDRHGAIVSLPLIVGEKVTGVMNITFSQSHDFDENQLRALELLADQAATSVRNAELFEAAQRQLEELQILHAVSTVGAAATHEDAIIEYATQLIGNTFYPDHFGILLLNKEDKKLHFHPSYRGLDETNRPHAIALGRGISGWVAQQGKTRRVPDVTQEPAYLPAGPSIRSELCVPMRVGGQVIGVVNAESSKLNAFTENDERLLSTFAGQLGTAIEKVRLFKEIQNHADELAAALARQQELDQLKSDFIRNTSHELGTPLAIIRGHLELLEAGELGELSPTQKHSVEIATRRSRMMTHMIKDLVAILTAEDRKERRDLLDLTLLAREIVEEFKLSTEQAGLSLSAEIASGPVMVLGDAQQLKRVIDNLLSNALKFTPPGGKILIQLREESDTAILSIADTGIGIPNDKLDRIFDRFYQVDGSSTRRYGGTGLGLALVKEVITSHGGTVTVESTLGEGSTFSIKLSLMQEPSS